MDFSCISEKKILARRIRNIFHQIEMLFSEFQKERENFGFDDSKPDEQEEQKAENFAE